MNHIKILTKFNKKQLKKIYIYDNIYIVCESKKYCLLVERVDFKWIKRDVFYLLIGGGAI